MTTSEPFFNYETIKETEKAVFAKVPYWEATSQDVKKHKQLFFEGWIPKVILSKSASDVKFFVMQKREEIRCKNDYQRILSKMPAKFRTMGEFAPAKERFETVVLDDERLNQLKLDLAAKYGFRSIDGFVTNCLQNWDVPISPEDEIYVDSLRIKTGNDGKITNLSDLPTKIYTYYK